MHRSFYPLVTGILLASGPVTVAQQRRERPRPVLLALDLDYDGTLSPSEIQAAPASLQSLDRNGDGELTFDEIEPPRAENGASADAMVTQLMSFDCNADGVLTPDELPARMRPMFARGDTNHDGTLTPDEIRTMAVHTGSATGRRAEPGKASGTMRLDPVLNALDADHDGVLSAAEMANASAVLLTLDANHNGTLEAVEMRIRQQTPAERTEHMLDEWDANKDGRLSRDEVPDGLRPRFAAADTNGDGYLDAAELTHMFATQQQQPGGPAAPVATKPKGQQN